jgi:geranylgeranyl pyrophosphate synthase
MSILAAIRREEKKVKKQLAKLHSDLDGLQSAAKALGKSAGRDLKNAKKSLLSAAARAKMSKAAKKRWAKIKAEARKAAA